MSPSAACAAASASPPRSAPPLPTAVDVLGALDTQHDSALADYDPFDFTSFGLRNRLERPPHCS